jgi:hypothetical protein
MERAAQVTGALVSGFCHGLLNQGGLRAAASGITASSACILMMRQVETRVPVAPRWWFGYTPQVPHEMARTPRGVIFDRAE